MNIYGIESIAKCRKKLKLMAGVTVLSGTLFLANLETGAKNIEEGPSITASFKEKSTNKTELENSIVNPPQEATSEFWKESGEWFHGYQAPRDTSISIWYFDPTRGVTCNAQPIPSWKNIKFDFPKVIGKICYEELASSSENVETVIIPVYASADRAINQTEAIIQDNLCENFKGARLGNLYYLSYDGPKILEDVSTIGNLPAEEWAMSLIRENSNGEDEIIGYINASYVVNLLTPYELEQEYDAEKQLLKQKWHRNENIC